MNASAELLVFSAEREKAAVLGLPEIKVVTSHCVCSAVLLKDRTLGFRCMNVQSAIMTMSPFLICSLYGELQTENRKKCEAGIDVNQGGDLQR
jgi:hypothetical protein